MHQTEEPAIRDYVHNRLDTLKGVLFLGDIVNQQQDAGDHLDHKGRKGHHPEGIKEIEVVRDPVPGQLGFDEFIEADSDLEPVSDLLHHLVTR